MVWIKKVYRVQIHIVSSGTKLLLIHGVVFMPDHAADLCNGYLGGEGLQYLNISIKKLSTMIF